LRYSGTAQQGKLETVNQVVSFEAMNREKRKKKKEDDGQKQCVVKKCKKVVGEVLELSKTIANDDFRRRVGQESRMVLGIKGESYEECVEAEETERALLSEIGSKVSNVLLVRNMEKDWKGVGWMHLRKAFAKPFMQDLFKEEVEFLMLSVVEEDRDGMKQKSIQYGLQDDESVGVISRYPIHDTVMRKILEKLVVGATVVREIIFFVEDIRDVEGKECKGGMSEKIMKEISLESTGIQAEPIAVVVPIVGSLIVKTYQQYKKHVGRPRKAKEHVTEVGDMFMLNWRQLHSISCSSDSGEKEAKWVIFAAATKENHLIY
jgi:hypothetical protein